MSSDFSSRRNDNQGDCPHSSHSNAYGRKRDYKSIDSEGEDRWDGSSSKAKLPRGEVRRKDAMADHKAEIAEEEAWESRHKSHQGVKHNASGDTRRGERDRSSYDDLRYTRMDRHRDSASRGTDRRNSHRDRGSSDGHTHQSTSRRKVRDVTEDESYVPTPVPKRDIRDDRSVREVEPKNDPSARRAYIASNAPADGKGSWSRSNKETSAFHRGKDRGRSLSRSSPTISRSSSTQSLSSRSSSRSLSESDHRSHRHKRRRSRSRSQSRDRASRKDSKGKKKRRSSSRQKRRDRKNDTKRSVLTGKKIKLKVKKDRGDDEREAKRQELLKFLNSTYE